MGTCGTETTSGPREVTQDELHLISTKFLRTRPATGTRITMEVKSSRSSTLDQEHSSHVYSRAGSSRHHEIDAPTRVPFFPEIPFYQQDQPSITLNMAGEMHGTQQLDFRYDESGRDTKSPVGLYAAEVDEGKTKVFRVKGVITTTTEDANKHVSKLQRVSIPSIRKQYLVTYMPLVRDQTTCRIV